MPVKWNGMLKIKTIFMSYRCLLIAAHAIAQDGGIDSTYAGTDIVKYTFGFNHAGSITTANNGFTDSLNRTTLTGITLINGLINFFS